MLSDLARRSIISSCQFRLAVDFHALGSKHDLRFQHSLLKSPTVHIMALFRFYTFLQLAQMSFNLFYPQYRSI